MMDYGTLVWPFENAYPSNFKAFSEGVRNTFAIANLASKHKRQAKLPLSQQASRLQDLRDLDPQVLTEIHTSYYPEIFRYVRYRVTDEAHAEDIASETFLRLLDAVDAEKGPRRSIRGWLFGTASNLINDHFRRLYREDELLTDQPVDNAPGDSADKFERLEHRDLLDSAITQLTEEQQHVIALRFGSGLTIQETAYIMEKNENAVKGLQYRAIRSLRQELEVDE